MPASLCPYCRFKAVSAKSKEDLVSQGFTEFTIEDFHNTVSPAAGSPLGQSGGRVAWPWGGRSSSSLILPCVPAGGSSWT